MLKTWQKWVSRIVTVVLMMILVGVAALLVISRSSSFHRYVLRKIVEKTEEATGGKVEIGDFRFRWSGYADVYRFVLHGTESEPVRPLSAAQHIGIGLTLSSLLQQKVDLREIVIDQPVVHILVDKSGNTNIPRPRVPTKENQPIDIFDLAIKHFVVNGGEFYYNDRQLPLEAELHDLQSQVRFATLKPEYDGSLSYRRGRIRYGDFNPIQHDFSTNFSATPSRIRLDNALLTTGRSRVSTQAILTNYTNPVVDGTYQATLATDDLRRILNEPALPVGEVATNGSVRYQSAPNLTFLDALSIDGNLSSPALAVRLAEGHGEIRAVRGRYRLDKGSLDANDLQADLLGGHVTASLNMTHLATNAESRLVASMRAISLDAASAALSSRPLERVPIMGRVDGKVEAAWHGSLKGLRIRSDGTVAASTELWHTGVGGKSNAPIPVNGDIHLEYDEARNSVSLSGTYLRTPHTNVRLNGTASERSSLSVEATNDDLREIDSLALLLRMVTTRPGQQPAPQLIGLSGSAQVAGQMVGSLKAPRFTAQVTVNNFQCQGFSGRLLRTGVSLGPSEVALTDGDLEINGHSSIKFSGAVGLRGWSYAPSQHLVAQVTATKVPLDDLEHWAKLQYPVTGLLNANISVHGSQLNPAGQGSVRLLQASAWNQPIQSLALQFHGTGDSIASTLAVQTSAGSLKGDVTYYPRREAYDGEIEARNIKLDQLQVPRFGTMGIAGTLTAVAKGSGTFKSPQLEATAEIPELQIRQQRISAIKAQVNVANERATLALDSRVAEAYLKANGTVDLTGDNNATATFDARGLPLGPLLESYLPSSTSELRGQTDIRGDLKGPLKDPTRLEAHIEIPKFFVGYHSIQLANAKPIRMDYRNSVLTLERSEIKGTDTDVEIQATVPLQGSAAIAASAVGSVDLHVIRVFDPEVSSSGQIKLDVAARGDRSHPAVQGRIQVVNAAFQMQDTPLGAEKLNAELNLTNDRIEIKQFTGECGGGTLAAQGYVAYQPEIQFNLGLTADHVRLRYPEGVRAMLRGDLALRGGPQASQLSGHMEVTSLSFTNSFDLSTFVNQFTGESVPPPSEGFAANMNLNVGVQTSEEVSLESAHQLSLQGSANLRIAGTAADPVILGRANLTGGEVFFLGNRYEIQSGQIALANPVRTEPVVNLLVNTTVEQFNLSLSFVGPIERMRTTYTSDPPLPPVDIINLLAFGKTAAESQAASTTTTASQGAESVLAQGLTSQVSSQLEKFTGISNLSIDPLVGANQRNPGQELAIQDRVTKNLLLTFATDVSSTQGASFQVEYQLSPKWSTSVSRDQWGAVAVGVKMHKKF
jgi:translocation and assembly module TamB